MVVIFVVIVFDWLMVLFTGRPWGEEGRPGGGGRRGGGCRQNISFHSMFCEFVCVRVGYFLYDRKPTTVGNKYARSSSKRVAGQDS